MNRLLGAIALVTVVMTALACVRSSIWSYGADTGTFAQSIFNAFAGFANSVEPGGTHLQTHWSPIIAVLWPLVALTHSPLSIQIAQAAIVALAALPLYYLILPYAGELWAFRCGVLALIYPPLLSNAFTEFHELAFYPVLALAMLWAADRARWLWYGIFAVAIVLVREDACLDLIVVGLVIAAVAWIRRESAQRGLLYGEPIEPRKCAVAGLALAGLSLASLAVYALVVLPRYGRWAPAHFYIYPFANGPVQVVLAAFIHPAQFAHAIVTVGRFTYLLEIFVPLALLPLLSRWTLLAVPALAGILLSNNGVVWRMGTHYVLLVVPWVLLGGAWALVTIVQSKGSSVAARWWISAVALCAIVLVAFDPMHPIHYLRAEPYQQSANVERAFACLPRTAAVGTHDEWLAHFAIAYPHVTQFGKTPEDFPGYVAFADDWQNPNFRHMRAKIVKAWRRGRYRLVCSFGDVRVLQRR